MKLGSSKKMKQAELIDALGGDYVASGIGLPSEPPTPSAAAMSAPAAKAAGTKGRGSLPEVDQERYVFSIPSWFILICVLAFTFP
jgi:hypothetical protein